MIFGGLSESEVKQIKLLLERANIQYKISTDETIMEINQLSMQNNLRHLNPPNISKSVLKIEISDTDFDSLDEATLAAFSKYGITDRAPEDMQFPQHPDFNKSEHPGHHLLKGNKRVVGFNLFHQLLFMIVIVLFIWLLKSL